MNIEVKQQYQLLLLSLWLTTSDQAQKCKVHMKCDIE